jgi:hypothetical protein
LDVEELNQTPLQFYTAVQIRVKAEDGIVCNSAVLKNKSIVPKGIYGLFLTWE